MPHQRCIIVALFLCVACASCASVGPDKLLSSHTSYNDAVQMTVAREVLANIVRSRYADPMQFIQVTAINASFSVSAGGSAGVGGIGQAGTAGQAAGSVGYSESPTITFIPQSDSGFYKSLHSQLGEAEAVGFARLYRLVRTQPGWDALSLRFSYAAINGEDDIILGEKNPRYEERIEALTWLIRNGAVLRAVPEWDYDSISMPKDKVTVEDKVDAFRFGLYFVEEDGGKNVRLARFRMVVALTLPEPADPDIRAALTELGVEPGRARYVIRPPLHATPGGSDPRAIWVTPRSMIGMLSLASTFVEVPAAHEGIVPSIDLFDATAPVRIRSAAEEPVSLYRVKHRGYWFYIDDTEIGSKVFLELLVAAYTSRVGSKQAGDDAPQTVIAVGGG